jgi:T-complex protein 1 subunit alpha
MSTGALAVDGERTSGQDIRQQNVTACMALANIVKSSLGPVGLDKMLVSSAEETGANGSRRARSGSTIIDIRSALWLLLQMQVDNIGDVTITNDGATILKQLEVDHPAAKVLVDLAELQDSEVGDGTTSVVIIAAELMRVRI